MKTLTRAHLVAAAHDAVIADRSDSENIVRDTLELISQALVAGDKVLISRFGTFTPNRRRARLGRNPKRPAEEHLIPAHVSLTFAAALELKAAVKAGPPAAKVFK